MHCQHTRLMQPGSVYRRNGYETFDTQNLQKVTSAGFVYRKSFLFQRMSVSNGSDETKKGTSAYETDSAVNNKSYTCGGRL